MRAKIERSLELKRQGPNRSDQVINQILRSEFGSGLASSTLYRHLAMHGATRKRLLDRARGNEATLMLIFDEAHLLSGDALVDLRLLVSSAVEVGPPLKILLVGQDHIRQTLKRSEYADIVNRISVRYQLRPLTKEQTRRYIDHQVVRHGGDSKIFDESVKDLIHDFTAGVPRSINNLAIACLLGATNARSMRIDEEAFRLANNEVHWN